MSKKCAKCSEACNTSCSNCKKVWYCSVDHQRSHRKEHKRDCFPVIAKESEEHGPCLVATRDIKQGETLWMDKPLMVAPAQYTNTPSTDTMCLGCCRILPRPLVSDEPPSSPSPPSQICSICHWPLCNPNCKDKKWHFDFECKILKENNVVPSDLYHHVTPPPWIYDSIRVLRIILLQKKNFDYWDKIINHKFSSFNGQQSHNTDLTLGYVDDFIRGKCKVEIPSDQIEHIMKITFQNSQRSEMTKTANQMLDHNVVRRCSKIMPHRGTFVHSCVPNISVSTSKDWLDDEIYATVDIKSGEILSVCGYQTNYETFAFRGYVERQRLIPIKHSSFCKCVLCIDPTERGTFLSAIKCTNEIDEEPCPGYFLPCINLTHHASKEGLEHGKWRCNNHHCHVEDKYSNLEKRIISLAKEILDTGSSTDKKLKLISKHENKTVHPNHFLIMKLLFDSLARLENKLDGLHYSSSRNLEECLNVANQIKALVVRCMKVADKIYPGVSGCRALLLYYLVLSSDRAYEYHTLLYGQDTTDAIPEYHEWKLNRDDIYREGLRMTSRARDYDASLSSSLYYKLRLKRVAAIETFNRFRTNRSSDNLM